MPKSVQKRVEKAGFAKRKLQNDAFEWEMYSGGRNAIGCDSVCCKTAFDLSLCFCSGVGKEVGGRFKRF